MKVETEEELDQLVSVMLAVWVASYEQLFRPNHCVAGSAAAYEAATYFGVDAELYVCNVMAANPAGWEQWSQGIPPGDWPPEAWSTGCGVGQPGENDAELRAEGRRPFDGHVVCLLAGRTLVDLSFRQFRRSHRGIYCEPLATSYGGTSSDGRMLWQATLPGNGRASWELLPGMTTYRQAGDWRNRSRVAGKYIRAVRAMMEGVRDGAGAD